MKRPAAIRLLPALALVAGGCSDPCADTDIRSVDSPDGRYRAVMFERNCGATTGFSTQISVVPRGEKLSGGEGNVFVADTDHGAAAAGSWGGPWADISWLGPSQLLVTYSAHARIFKQEGHAGSVQVDFRTGSQAGGG